MASAVYRAFKSYKLEREGMSKYDKPLRIINEGVVATERGTPETIVSDEADLEELAEEETSVANIPTSSDRQEAIPNRPVFKIQIATTSQRKAPSPANFNGLQAVEMYQEKQLYKYVYGSFFELDQAKESLKDVRKSGFPDAFIVAFHKGEKISVQEAIKRKP
jgi:N-acetylmuramoyl-L-alanine amidase